MILKSRVEMKGLGSFPTSVKYSMPFPNMECDHCDKPNLFNCHLIHGHLTSECQRRSLALYELELAKAWKGKGDDKE